MVTIDRAHLQGSRLGNFACSFTPGFTEIHLFREVPDGEQAVPPPAEPELPGIARKCKLEQAMSNTVIELLKVAPTNPVARAHALSQLKIPIPDEHQTFEAIKEWVEMNITPKTGRGVPSQVYPSVAGRAARPTEAFRIDAAVSERQSGTCRWVCNASGSGSVPIMVADLDSAVEDAESLEDVVLDCATASTRRPSGRISWTLMMTGMSIRTSKSATAKAET